MKTIVLNAMPEEMRCAVLENGKLISLSVKRPFRKHSDLTGNIYKGRVKNVLQGMRAAFVDIGVGKNVFLPLDGRNVCVGESVMVQIVREAFGAKAAKASLNISLSARMTVLSIGRGERRTGVSRRIVDAAERARLLDIAAAICPDGMGLLVRTAAEGKDEATIRTDCDFLVALYDSVAAKFKAAPTPSLLYGDDDFIFRIVRDCFADDVDEFFADDAKAYRKAAELTEKFSPRLLSRLKLYDEKEPIFSRFSLEREIESINRREVQLESGGSLVFDKTEALTVIDVNTGGFVGKTNPAETFYRMNLEAAAEIMRQIRLRDIGGIVIVDFIDMAGAAKKESLLAAMRDMAKLDPVRTIVGDVTPLGLVEISRKRERRSFFAATYNKCPYCRGNGLTESAETIAVKIARKIRDNERVHHAGGGYEVELNPVTAKKIDEYGMIKKLSRELGVKITVSTEADMPLEAYSVLRGED